MDFLNSHNKPTGGDHGKGHAAGEKHGGGGGHHRPASTSELLSSAKLVADAAKSGLGSDKVDKGKVAGAAADLLDAAAHYGKLEEKGVGKYMEKAEDYLRHYNTSHSSTGTATGHVHSDSAPPALHDDGGHHKSREDGGESGNKYGDYLKMAQGFINKH